jgi:hypothetical protein
MGNPRADMVNEEFEWRSRRDVAAVSRPLVRASAVDRTETCAAIRHNVGRVAPNRKLGRGHIPIELAQLPVVPAPAGIQAKSADMAKNQLGLRFREDEQARVAGRLR